MTDAGWYSDPFGKGEHRYHNGSGWTAHIGKNGARSVDPTWGDSGDEPPTAPPGRTAPSPTAFGKREVLGALASLAAIVGSLGPWRTIGALHVSGTTISDDAYIGLGGGIIALVLIIIDRWAWLVGLLGGIIALSGIYDINGVTDVTVLGVKATVGWGLALMIAGGIGLVAWRFTNRWLRQL